LPTLIAHKQHEGNLRNHLKAAGLPTTGTPKTWATDETVKQFVFDSLKSVGKRNGLGRNETLRDIIMTTEEWSPDNGMLTAAMKLARPYITKTYVKEIEVRYSGRDRVLRAGLMTDCLWAIE
jgi:long-chain acyl-CoA synthetase